MVHNLHTISAPQLSTGGKLLGTFGMGAISIGILILLIGGIAGKGNIKIKSWKAALFIGFLFVAACTATGQMWTIVPEVGASTGQALSDGFSNAGIGDVGLGGLCIIVVILINVMKMAPAGGAWAGIFMSGMFTAAGGIWTVPATLLASVLASIVAKLGG
ncbi:hypothetical protein [Streptomyces sp. NPDC056056]|uniref:hypothetical protein n=1 Tax=Streptomyces sp. NPDC056056 TaxID=3345698 RepID=UPI0035DB587F